jgi:NAD(P)-dependent dehydrogenase (short-subunit alcohol dehydrogenase family)
VTASPFSLQGMRILVTGAAGAIGAATARLCAAQGACLVLADIKPEMPVADELRAAGTLVELRTLDVADRAAVEALVVEAGPFDAIVANAGYVVWNDWDEEGWDATFHRIIDVNLLGTIHLVRAALPGMTTRGRGKIVIVTSVAGKVGGVRSGPHYVAAKGGLNAFIKWAARKAAPHGVHVNGIAPGPTQSPMTAGQAFDLSAIPLGRLGRPEDMAGPIAFLCSAASDYICGSVLDVNGGIFMS